MKSFIEKNLQENYSPHDLTKWFKPLNLYYDEKNTKLTVLFPHAFFEPWFAKQGKSIFEKSVMSVAMQEYGCIPSIEYVVHSSQRAKFSYDITSPNNSTSREKTFANFFYNKKNEFSIAAAQEVAKITSTFKYNPLVIYGKSSTGKTHILKSIHSELLNLNKNGFNIFFSTGKDLYLSMHKLGLKCLLNDYEAFIIDDFHNIDTTNEFQHLLIEFIDLCTAKNKQIIIASNTSPITQKKYVEPLRLRISMGLVTKLNPPDIDVRMRFILSFCQEEEVKISKKQLLLVAQRCTSISILRGIILKIKAFKELSHKSLDDFDLESILFSLSDEKKSISYKDIINITSKHLNVDKKEIFESARQPQVVKARQIAMYLCRDLLGLSYPNIGKIFAGKDHSTVMYSIKKVTDSLDTHKDMHDMVTKIKQKCLSI